MAFEILFITEDPDITPAAEIQFAGQRVCIIRLSRHGSPEIEFVKDRYLGKDVEMVFPLKDFVETVELAVSDLASWLDKLAEN
ncbi:hypothetical protein [Dyella mobilis]|uniref:Uncharacterized protein n=1 Tax=Dyella mobilis TaxID=1849582 RepID=A0ABS2KD06_9GAMM|nr:hypothetical protein [Dyella mobilis]MBM7128824.1 hypothetical protein [Dyella mobilis]GLQ99156.1 hypothetical protein GCM10007863_35760 [Dyella mobilis]